MTFFRSDLAHEEQYRVVAESVLRADCKLLHGSRRREMHRHAVVDDRRPLLGESELLHDVALRRFRDRDHPSRPSRDAADGPREERPVASAKELGMFERHEVVHRGDEGGATSVRHGGYEHVKEIYRPSHIPHARSSGNRPGERRRSARPGKRPNGHGASVPQRVVARSRTEAEQHKPVVACHLGEPLDESFEYQAPTPVRRDPRSSRSASSPYLMRRPTLVHGRDPGSVRVACSTSNSVSADVRAARAS